MPRYQIAAGIATQYATASRNADSVVPPRARSAKPATQTANAVSTREIFIFLSRVAGIGALVMKRVLWNVS